MSVDLVTHGSNLVDFVVIASGMAFNQYIIVVILCCKNQREDKLREKDILKIVYFVVLLIYFVKLSISEFREILFYKNNGWDFRQDSKTDIRVYKGDSAEAENEY